MFFKAIIHRGQTVDPHLKLENSITDQWVEWKFEYFVHPWFLHALKMQLICYKVLAIVSD